MFLPVSVLLTTSADAHLVNSGFGPFYDGVGHFFLSPEDLVPVIAMAILAGLNGQVAARRALFVLTGTWLLAGIAGAFFARPLVPAVLIIGSSLLLGSLVAADRRLSPTVVGTLAAAVGILHGWLNGAGTASAKVVTVEALLGIASAVFVLVAILAAGPIAVRSEWKRVGFRVAGSWIAAIGLLMLGWELRQI